MTAKKYCPMQQWSPDKAPKDMLCKREMCEWWQPYLTRKKEDRGQCVIGFLVTLKYMAGE